MTKRSAGLLICRQHEDRREVLLVHPGGPYWAKKDEGCWSIPKGLVNEGEDDLAAARRETKEEIGVDIDGSFTDLGCFKQPGGKMVIAWAVRADLDASSIRSNTFSMEWPPRSGAMREFPEVDRAAWFTLPEADVKLLPGQRPILLAFAERFPASSAGG
ncbi:NUDIX hydrolase [Rhizobium sp. AC44/96]|uniref:NUDIX domain-containing protein n=1 Tax=Rhizobium sp. AC44/96 TaxID=1841654 RepID=UPI00080FE2FB|nr:NUDIX domain-containing protein [Rhizobium sp. AC44/96]OCJ05025.1 NUDIX hydrolase [Rhizobium sp. AC44/96]